MPGCAAIQARQVAQDSFPVILMQFWSLPTLHILPFLPLSPIHSMCDGYTSLMCIPIPWDGYGSSNFSKSGQQGGRSY
eukprot:1159369-Pelagomonas_calceolata.AAC.7